MVIVLTTMIKDHGHGLNRVKIGIYSIFNQCLRYNIFIHAHYSLLTSYEYFKTAYCS